MHAFAAMSMISTTAYCEVRPRVNRFDGLWYCRAAACATSDSGLISRCSSCAGASGELKLPLAEVWHPRTLINATISQGQTSNTCPLAVFDSGHCAVL